MRYGKGFWKNKLYGVLKQIVGLLLKPARYPADIMTRHLKGNSGRKIRLVFILIIALVFSFTTLSYFTVSPNSPLWFIFFETFLIGYIAFLLAAFSGRWHSYVVKNFRDFEVQDRVSISRISGLSLPVSSSVFLLNLFYVILSYLGLKQFSIIERLAPQYAFGIILIYLRIGIPKKDVIDTAFESLSNLRNIPSNNQLYVIRVIKGEIEARIKNYVPHLFIDLRRVFSLVYCINYLGDAIQRFRMRQFLVDMKMKMENPKDSAGLINHIDTQITALQSPLLSNNMIDSICKWERRRDIRSMFVRYSEPPFYLLTFVSIIDPSAIPNFFTAILHAISL